MSIHCKNSKCRKEVHWDDSNNKFYDYCSFECVPCCKNPGCQKKATHEFNDDGDGVCSEKCFHDILKNAPKCKNPECEKKFFGSKKICDYCSLECMPNCKNPNCKKKIKYYNAHNKYGVCSVKCFCDILNNAPNCKNPDCKKKVGWNDYQSKFYEYCSSECLPQNIKEKICKCANPECDKFTYYSMRTDTHSKYCSTMCNLKMVIKKHNQKKIMN
jgi:hypothetical protein